MVDRFSISKIRVWVIRGFYLRLSPRQVQRYMPITSPALLDMLIFLIGNSAKLRQIISSIPGVGWFMTARETYT